MSSDFVQRISSETILTTPWLTVTKDIVRFGKDASPVDYYVVGCQDYAQIVAVTSNGELILVEQYKHGCGAVVLELPAGGIECDEEPRVAAARELYEEAGAASNSWQSLGSFHVSSARMKTSAHGYLATDVVFVGQVSPDENESIAVRLFPLSKVNDLLAKGEITDLGSGAFLFLARIHRPDLPWEDFEEPS